MQGNSRDVGSQAADTFFLPVILLPGTLPVKISSIPHAESYFANGCLMGDLLIWICDTSGEGVYAAHKVNATSWMFPVDVTIDLPDGVYDAHVATSEFAPISLILGGAS